MCISFCFFFLLFVPCCNFSIFIPYTRKDARRLKWWPWPLGGRGDKKSDNSFKRAASAVAKDKRHRDSWGDWCRLIGRKVAEKSSNKLGTASSPTIYFEWAESSELVRGWKQKAMNWKKRNGDAFLWANTTICVIISDQLQMVTSGYWCVKN